MAARESTDRGDARLESGEAWQRLCDQLQRCREIVLGEDVPDSPQMRAEGFRYLTRFLEAGIRSCVSHADPDQPVFCRMIEYGMSWGLDAPDCLYLYAPLRGDRHYRIEGHRGSANHIDVQVNAGHYALGNVGAIETIASVNGQALSIGSDGRFELVLGGAAEDHPDVGNWLPLRDDAGFVLVRQYFDDWENEDPADLEIERIGAAYPAPPPTSAQVAEGLERLETWLARGGALWERMSRSFLGLDPNSLLVHLPEAAGEHSGLAGQAYGIGNFRCEPDQAVLLEFEPPPCHHWSVSLATWYWESVDYATRQSSLNRHQAEIDEDGTFRAVIAHRDPGVANWLDPGGHTLGSIAARFLLADHAPKPRMRVVPLAGVDAELPADTARVGPEERAERLARRRRAVIRRTRV